MAAAHASTGLNPLYLRAFRRIELHPTDAARLAHNPKVAASNPAPLLQERTCKMGIFFL